jgi:hypothetical protein
MHLFLVHKWNRYMTVAESELNLNLLNANLGLLQKKD